MKNDILVSIIIATYNRCNYLRQLLNSILKQTYKNIEIIVINDNSNDETDKILDQYEKITIFKNKTNKGCNYSRKRGYASAKGQLIIFCDDDDYYTDDRFIEKAVAKMKEDQNISVLVSDYREVSNNRTSIQKININKIIHSSEYLEGIQIRYKKPPTFAAVFRKDSFDYVNLETITAMNDASIFMYSLIKKGYVYHNQEACGSYRIHDNNMSKNVDCKFIIENLNEKRKISTIASKLGAINDKDEWISKQTLLTIKYFLHSNKASNDAVKELEKWIKKNLNSRRQVLIVKIRAYYILIKVMQIIRHGKQN